MVQVIKDLGLSSYVDVRSADHAFLFLHGFPDTKEVWLPVIKRISDQGVLAPDLPSFGDSDIVADSQMRIQSIADKIVALIDTTGITTVTIVSHDWGTVVGCEVQKRMGNRVAAMIIANGPHPSVYAKLILESPAQREISKYINYFCLDGAADRLLRNNMQALKMFHPFDNQSGSSSEIQFESKWSDPRRLNACLGIYRANLSLMNDSESPMSVLSCPVRVFWGKRDHSLVIEHVNELRAVCSSAYVSKVVDAGHWAFLEKVDEFSNFVLGLP